MNRALSTREKVMLVILCLLLIGIAYYKFLLEPINDSVTEYQSMTQMEQDMILQNTALIQKKKNMEAELEQIFAQGTPTPIPSYDNSGVLMVELHSILSSTIDYTLSFGNTSTLSCGYRQIINRLHGSDNISQISDLTISRVTLRNTENEGAISVKLVVTYFELC